VNAIRGKSFLTKQKEKQKKKEIGSAKSDLKSEGVRGWGREMRRQGTQQLDKK